MPLPISETTLSQHKSLADAYHALALAHARVGECLTALLRAQNTTTRVRATHPPSGPVPCLTEQTLYYALGLAYIEPKNRELDWLRKNIDSGL